MTKLSPHSDGKMMVFNECARPISYPYVRKGLGHYFIPCTETNSKWVIELNVKSKTIKMT